MSAQSNDRVSALSESQQQIGEAALRLPTYVPCDYGLTAKWLHPKVVELREEFRDDVIALPSLLLPLMHTWTYKYVRASGRLSTYML